MEHLSRYLRAISNALAQDMQQKSEQLGLTSAQGMFLHYLWKRQTQEQQRTYAKDLESFFYVKHSTVSGILQRMESGGFLTFNSEEADRRCKSIVLTQKALDAHAQFERHLQHTEQRLTQGMTEDERNELLRLLRLAAKNLGMDCKAKISEKEDTTCSES